MTHRLLALAGGRCVVALEGGYNLRSISRSMEAVARVLLGQSPPPLFHIPGAVHKPRAALGPTATGGPADASAVLPTTTPAMREIGSIFAHLASGQDNDDDNEDNGDGSSSVGSVDRDDVLGAVAPSSGPMQTIAHVARIHARFWPVLRAGVRAYGRAASAAASRDGAQPNIARDDVAGDADGNADGESDEDEEIDQEDEEEDIDDNDEGGDNDMGDDGDREGGRHDSRASTHERGVRAGHIGDGEHAVNDDNASGVSKRPRLGSAGKID